MVLIVALLLSIGGVLVAAPDGATWSQVFTPQVAGGIAISLGGTLAAAFGVKTK